MIITAVFVISGYAFIWAKLGLAMPAAALGNQTGFVDAMALAKGNTAQIAQALIVTWLTLGFLGAILVMALTALGTAVGSQYLVFVGVLLFYYLSLVASVGVLSRAYSALRT
jgi:pheromone shutdown protein TraB